MISSNITDSFYEICYHRYADGKSPTSVIFDRLEWEEIRDIPYPIWTTYEMFNEKFYVFSYPDGYISVSFYYDEDNNLTNSYLHKLSYTKYYKNTLCRELLYRKNHIETYYPNDCKNIKEAISFIQKLKIEKCKNRLEFITGARTL
jgi:hypothetical protein